MRCTRAGCNLLAGPRNGADATGSGKCCGYFPTPHAWWARLSRHTADERAAALQHQAAHDSTGDKRSTSSVNAEPAHEPSAVETVMNVYEFVSRAWLSSPGDDVSPIPVTKASSTSTGAESTTLRVDAVTDAVLQAASGARRAAAESVADDTAMDARWMAPESRLQSETEKAAVAHDQAFAAQVIKREADGEVRPAATSSAASTIPVIANWVT